MKREKSVLSCQQMWGKACDKIECSCMKRYLGTESLSDLIRDIYWSKAINFSRKMSKFGGRMYSMVTLVNNTVLCICKLLREIR